MSQRGTQSVVTEGDVDVTGGGLGDSRTWIGLEGFERRQRRKFKTFAAWMILQHTEAIQGIASFAKAVKGAFGKINVQS